MARILGIDAGDVRTGVALSDPGEFMASGLCTLTEYSEERLIDRLCALIALHNAEKVRGKKRKQTVDTLSAEIILQNYLDKKRNGK